MTRHRLLVDWEENVVRDLVILLIDETGLAVAIPIVPIGSWLGQTPSRLEVSSDTCPGGHGPNPGAQYYIYRDAAGRVSQ